MADETKGDDYDDEYPKLTVLFDGCKLVGSTEPIHDDDSAQYNCSVCLNQLTEKCIDCVVDSNYGDCIIIDGCYINGHLFHEHCINKWLKGKMERKCPLCNEPFSDDPKIHKID